MEIENNIQWHPAFCSAMELELLENNVEYKTSGDDVNVGTFYKALSYTCINPRPVTLKRSSILTSQSH